MMTDNKNTKLKIDYKHREEEICDAYIFSQSYFLYFIQKGNNLEFIEKAFLEKPEQRKGSFIGDYTCDGSPIISIPIDNMFKVRVQTNKAAYYFFYQGSAFTGMLHLMGVSQRYLTERNDHYQEILKNLWYKKISWEDAIANIWALCPSLADKAEEEGKQELIKLLLPKLRKKIPLKLNT